jgi:dTDP-4-dehydrorhamnose 3,5-epimerase
MKFNTTPLPGVILIDLDVYPDPRGFFIETFHQKKYTEGGISEIFVQDNFSRSSRGTLRGLHAQLTHPQAKLVHIVSGEIWDVAVDVRPGSATYKKWFGARLSADKPQQLYIPIGFAHGFCVMSDVAEVAYKCTDLYDPSNELHLLWNDPDLAVDWPIKDPVLSAKDKDGVGLRQVEPILRQFFGTPKSK